MGFFLQCMWNSSGCRGVLYCPWLEAESHVWSSGHEPQQFVVVSNALRLRFFHVLRKPVAGNEEAAELKETALNMEQERTIETTEAEDKTETTAEAVENKEEKMMYTMKIEGMMCAHCQAAVNKALNGMPGVKAEVNLEKKEAYVEAEASVTKEALSQAVVEAGYE